MAVIDDSSSAGEPAEEVRTAGSAPPRSEWAVAALGAILVLAAIAQLVYTSIGRDRAPPDITLAVERVIEQSGGYLVMVRVRNHGRSAAAEVEIEGELGLADGSAETSGVTLDYLAPYSDREGGLLFTRDPQTGQLQLRAKGFAIP